LAKINVMQLKPNHFLCLSVYVFLINHHTLKARRLRT
jgi:hypothetical protein